MLVHHMLRSIGYGIPEVSVSKRKQPQGGFNLSKDGSDLSTSSCLSGQQLRDHLTVFQIPRAPQPEFRHELLQ